MTAGSYVPDRALAKMVPNSTYSEPRVGWVTIGGGRGTSEILWSCLIIFVVCSWKCVHLNIPSFDENTAGWHQWGDVPLWPRLPVWAKWARKLEWMGVIVIAPEVGVALAVKEHSEAKELCSRMGNGWTMTHAFYTNMGGFALRSGISLPELQAWVQAYRKRSSFALPEPIIKHQQYGRSKTDPTNLATADLDVEASVSKERTEEALESLFWVDSKILRKSKPKPVAELASTHSQLIIRMVTVRPAAVVESMALNSHS